MTRLTAHEYAAALRQRYRAAKKGVKRRDVEPGSLQADLVLHCGVTVEGFFLTTLCAVDAASGWSSLQPVREKISLTRARGAPQTRPRPPEERPGLRRGEELADRPPFPHQKHELTDRY
jgi:hypothetical protein